MDYLFYNTTTSISSICVKTTISVKEKELEGIKPTYEEMRKKEDEYTRELSLKEQKRKELYAKQVR